MNKKGGIFGEAFSDIITYIVILLIIIGFGVYFIFFPKAKSTEVIKVTELDKLDLVLLNILRTPINYDFNIDGTTDNGNVADLIVLAYKLKDLVALENNLKFINKDFEGSLFVSFPDGTYYGNCADFSSFVDTQIPTDDNKIIKVSFCKAGDLYNIDKAPSNNLLLGAG